MAKRTTLAPRTLGSGALALVLLRCSLVIGDLPDPSAAHVGHAGAGAGGFGPTAHAGGASAQASVPPLGGDTPAESSSGGEASGAGADAAANAGANDQGATDGTPGRAGTSNAEAGGSGAAMNGGASRGGASSSAGAGEGGGAHGARGGAPPANGGQSQQAGGSAAAGGLDDTNAGSAGMRSGSGGVSAAGGSAHAGTGGSSAAASGAGGGSSGGSHAGAPGSSGGAGGSNSAAGGSGGKSECDADHDGALSESAVCGGTDCDDADSSVHPGQANYFTSASAAVGFDYDCNGQSEPEFQAIDCSQQPVVGCAGEGFSGTAPACGEDGAWIECAPAVAPLPLLCVPVDKGTRRQACH